MRLCSLALGLSLVVVACGQDARPTTPSGIELGAAGGSGAASGSDAAVIDDSTPVVRASPPRGVPHYAAVVATAVSRDSSSALSRDALGEVRVWPTLDGKVAAQSVPVRGVVAMRVQDSADEILAGFAETSGAGHLVRFDRSGKRLGVADITGPGTVLHVAPLVDASGALVLFADHSLALVDRDGKTLDTIAVRGVRMRAIEAVGTTSALLLMRHSEGDGTATNTVARVETAGGKLKLGAEVALPYIPLEPTRFAASSDGARIAFTRDQEDAKAKPVAPAAGPSAPGAPRADRREPPLRPPPPPPPGRMARVVVVTMAGKDVTPDELKQQVFNDVVTLGFSAQDKLHVFETSNQSEVDLVGGVVIAGTLVRTAAASVGDGMLVTGYEVSLLTQVPGGAVKYLGWQANVPQKVALSTDGARAAWASARGELVIETLDGSSEVYGGLFDAPVTFLSFVGEEHVLLGSGRGTVHLVDAKTGKEVGAMAPPGPVARVEVDAKTGWLAGLRPGGGVWLLRVKPGEPLPTTTYAVADGANNFALLAASAADAPLLMTVDAKLVQRKYTEAELIAGVSAKSIRERPSVKLPRAMNRFDRRGLGYAIESRKLVIWDGATLKQSIPLGFDIQDVAITDDGAHLIVLGSQTPVAEIGLDGKTRWTLSMGPGGRWAWAFSSDGARLAVIGSGGGLVVDAATGERVAAGCAWRFGATAAPPLSRAVGVVPVCR
jgi:hypothetical protein